MTHAWLEITDGNNKNYYGGKRNFEMVANLLSEICGYVFPLCGVFHRRRIVAAALPRPRTVVAAQVVGETSFYIGRWFWRSYIGRWRWRCGGSVYTRRAPTAASSAGAATAASTPGVCIYSIASAVAYAVSKTSAAAK